MTWAACPLWRPCEQAIPGPEAMFDLGWILVSAFVWLLIFLGAGLGGE